MVREPDWRVEFDKLLSTYAEWERKTGQQFTNVNISIVDIRKHCSDEEIEALLESADDAAEAYECSIVAAYSAALEIAMRQAEWRVWPQ